MCYDASFVVFGVLKLLADLLDFQEFVFYWKKQIDEQKKMISKQAHLVVQRIQKEQHLKSSLKEKDKEIDSLHDIVNNLEVRLEHQEQYSRRTSL
jgi:hypothetical protein